jgi:hypothetical protein
MTQIGFDADQDCSGVADAAAAKGVKFICRYLKNLRAAEVAAVHNAGIAIVLIWETTAERALLGAPAGVVDGTRARDMASALGAPAGTAIYLTADFGEVVAQDAVTIGYFAAAKRAFADEAKMGGYAEGAVCQAGLDAGIFDYTWLAGGMGMRGSRAFADSGRATIVQDVGDKQGLDLGIDIDSDVAIDGDIGAWLPPT